MAKQNDCKLLPLDARTLAVPRAREVDGGMGRYVWHAEGQKHKQFLKKVFELIRSGGKATTKVPAGKKGAGRGWQLDPRRRKRIEEAAVREVMRYYRKELLYEVKDRQNEHCGWDLEATKDGVLLHLEVKGVIGEEVVLSIISNGSNP